MLGPTPVLKVGQQSMEQQQHHQFAQLQRMEDRNNLWSNNTHWNCEAKGECHEHLDDSHVVLRTFLNGH